MSLGGLVEGQIQDSPTHDDFGLPSWEPQDQIEELRIAVARQRGWLDRARTPFDRPSSQPASRTVGN
jgi:hypothetical protein